MKRKDLTKLIKEEIDKVLTGTQILTPDEIKRLVKYDLNFTSDEYSEESDYFDDEDIRNQYLDTLNNPTLNNYIETIFMYLPIEYNGDDIYNDPEFPHLMEEFITVSVIHALGEKRYEEVKEELRKYVDKYSTILKRKYGQ